MPRQIKPYCNSYVLHTCICFQIVGVLLRILYNNHQDKQVPRNDKWVWLRPESANRITRLMPEDRWWLVDGDVTVIIILLIPCLLLYNVLLEADQQLTAKTVSYCKWSYDYHCFLRIYKINVCFFSSASPDDNKFVCRSWGLLHDWPSLISYNSHVDRVVFVVSYRKLAHDQHIQSRPKKVL